MNKLKPLKILNLNKVFYLIFFTLILISCSPSLLFTEDQFPEVKSVTSIPDKWQGKWKTSDSSSNSFISKDSISIGNFRYKIIESNLSKGEDTIFKDKLIFEDDWCFLSVFHDSICSTPKLYGYQIFIAHIDENQSILCWEMSYDYFLKHKLINKIPAIKYEYKTIQEDEKYTIQKMIPSLTYIDLPKDNLHLYKKIIKNIIYVPNYDLPPAFCDLLFDFNFFKNIVLDRKPDVILDKNNVMKERKKNRYENKIERLAKRNMKRSIIKRIKSDF